jgi:hypothetical protein
MIIYKFPQVGGGFKHQFLIYCWILGRHACTFTPYTLVIAYLDVAATSLLVWLFDINISINFHRWAVSVCWELKVQEEGKKIPTAPALGGG